MPMLFSLFFLSGATGLVYELIWTRELIFVFGGTTYAITTVLVAFMGGLGIGSYIAGRLAHRLTQPGRVYGLLELFIGLYALCVPLLLDLAEPLYRALYPHAQGAEWLLNAARFCVGALTLVLPTVCMGATLPILVSYVTQRGGRVGESVGTLYGVNTLGAVAGVLATGFVLIPTLGLMRTTYTAAAANLLVGVLAVAILRSRPRADSEAPRRGGEQPPPAPADDLVLSTDALNSVLITFAVSGFAAMVYQITWTRALVMAIGSSTYSFTCILAAFILGLALGSLVVARQVDRWKNPLLALGIIQLAIGLAAVFVVPVLGRVPIFVHTIVMGLADNYAALLSAEFALIIAITLVPTLLMGAVFPLVTRMIAVRTRDPAAATGRAYLVNTFGTIAGSFLAGFVMIRSDVLGVQDSIWFAAALNGVLGAWLVLLARRAGGPSAPPPGLHHAAWAVAVAVPLLGWLAGDWDRITATSAPFLGDTLKIAAADEREIIYYAEGVDMTVAVEWEVGHHDLRALSVNGKTDASTGLGDLPTMLLLGHLGALFGNGGPDVCMVGLGGGLTLAALTRHPHFERIDCVEISEEVYVAAERFFSPFTYDVLRVDPRIDKIRADGRNHLLLTDRQYDLILSQPSNPWIAGVSNLFTREYFQLCDARLKEGGLLVAWVQAYSIGVDEFRMTIRTLSEVFDFVSVWDTAGDEYLILAGREPFRVDLETLAGRYAVPSVRADLHRVGISRVEQLLGQFITCGEPLRRWARTAPVNTDDNALLEFSAPRRLLEPPTFDIADALAELHCSPFPDVVAGEPDTPRYRAFAEHVERSAEGRRYRELAARRRAAGDLLGMLKAYVEGYRLDPGNVGLNHNFNYELSRLSAEHPETGENPALRPYLLELLMHRGPMLAPLTGGTLDDVYRFNIDRGARSAEGDYWLMAAEYFEVARRIQPDNPVLLHMLALAYGRIDRLDDAIEAIERVLAQQPEDIDAIYARAQLAVWTGDVAGALERLAIVLDRGMRSAKELATDGSLADLRDDPRFQTLLEEHGD